MVKSFLKGADGTLFPLLPKVTTIGRENCDFTIQLPGVDYQHCVLEYSEQDDCYVLQDLNTAQGTYVNDVRVQNAAVRLAPGDLIRFGYNGQPFELQFDNQTPMTIPPVSQRPPASWTQQPITLIGNQQDMSMYTTTGGFNPNQYGSIQQHQQQQQQQPPQSLPHITYSTNSTSQPLQSQTVWAHQVTQPPPPLPRPPLRSRPLSAGAARRNVQNIPPVGPTIGRGVTTNAWANQQQISRTSSIPDLQMQDKELRIHQLSDEVTRLRTFEFDSVRKDTLIQQLQQQIESLQSQIKQEPSVIMGGHDGDTAAQLLHLDTELKTKNHEIITLKEQVNRFQSDRSSSPQLLRQELGERVKEISQLRNELERVKKDKNITSGLVTQMQRDMSNKEDEDDIVYEEEDGETDYLNLLAEQDNTISKLTREIEVLKKDIRERDIHSARAVAPKQPKIKNTEEVVTKQPKTKNNHEVTPKQPHSKNTNENKQGDDNDSDKGKESPKQIEENNAREKELTTLRQKFKTTENKVQEQLDLITELRGELEKTKAQIAEDKDAQRKVQTDLELSKTQLMDITRSERVVRVDLEQCQKRIERFRSRVIQFTFSTPGNPVPDKEINDDELLAALKKLVDERATLIARVKELEGEVKTAWSGKDDLIGHAQKLKEGLDGSLARLKENGFLCSSIKKEMSLIKSLTTDDNLNWIRDFVLEMLDAELKWEQETENCLEKHGVNIKISNDAPSKHMESLFVEWNFSIQEKEKLANRIKELVASHKEEMDHRLDAMKSEMDSKMKDAVEKANLQGEIKLNAAIDEIRAAETEKRESCIEMEKRKVEELEKVIQELRGSLEERQQEDQLKLDEANETLRILDAVKVSEKELQAQLAAMEVAREEDLEKFGLEKEELSKQYNIDLEAYKEQIRQHSVTICTLEERVQKLVKKNKEYQEETKKLKNSKPTPPPKPKVVVQRPREELAALEHVVNALRQENTVLKKEVRDSQDIIMGLRRDLTGASARLSDISGEMSEAQKQEMERNRELLKQRSLEMTELRQQMVKLSSIIDGQKEDIKKLEEQLGKEKKSCLKLKEALDEKSTRLVLLEEELSREKEEQKKQLDLIDHEGRITSELTSLGAQCRGERHGQIISRQREALAELRNKVKSLEHSRPPLPTQDQALQEVVLLKKELAEMRVNQALAEDKIIQSATSLDREIGKTRGLITPSNVEADMERSAHRETMDALEASEATFLMLLRAMAASLDLEEIEGLRPMAHIPKDEREALVEARETSCQLLANRIQVLKERISRKDDLLMGYEDDLSKLRQSQELADMKSKQVENLANDVRSRAEESHYLRESLSRTRDRLNQEKRLNTAIKTKKTFHLENEKAHLMNGHGKNRGLHCPIEDPRDVVKKRQQKDMMRRKNYEIKTLKSDLCTTEQELFDKQKRLRSIETNMGIEREIGEVVE